MAEKVEINILAHDQASGVMVRLKGSFTELNSALAIARQGAELLGQAYAFAKQGADLDFTRQRFDRLAESIGTTGDVLLNRMTQATKGTLSQFEAMKGASDLLSLGLAKNADEAIRLATVQTGLGMNMNQLVLTLTNQTTMRFDALGVSVDGFKEKVKQLEKAGMSADQAFKEAFLQQAEEQLLKVGNAADSAAGDFMRMEAEWKNFVDIFKETVVPLAEWPLRIVTADLKAINSFGEVRQAAFDAMKGADGFIGSIGAGREVYREWAQGILYGTDALDDQSTALENHSGKLLLDEEATKKLHEANRSMLGTIMTVQQELDRYKESHEDLISKQADLLNQMEALRQQGVEELSDEMVNLQREYANTGIEIEKLADKHDEAMNRIVFDMLMAKLSVDGLTGAEFQMALTAGQALGILDEKTAKIAENLNALTEAMASGSMLGSQISPESIQSIMAGNTFSQWSVQHPEGYVFDNIADGSRPGTRDAGGPGRAGEAYMIGSGAQPEVFVPGSDGWFFPNGGGGGITVIVPFNYSPALGTASRADIEQLAPVVGELVERELRNRHIMGGA